MLSGRRVSSAGRSDETSRTTKRVPGRRATAQPAHSRDATGDNRRTGQIDPEERGTGNRSSLVERNFANRSLSRPLGPPSRRVHDDLGSAPESSIEIVREQQQER